MQALLRLQLHLWHCSGSQGPVQGWGISWTELTPAFHVPSLRHRGAAAPAHPCLLRAATALEKPWKTREKPWKNPPFPADVAPKPALSFSTCFGNPWKVLSWLIFSSCRDVLRWKDTGVFPLKIRMGVVLGVLFFL